MNKVCKVCGGKGGWEHDYVNGLDTWMDCPMCEGYGFYFEIEPEERDLLDEVEEYNALMASKLRDIATVESFLPLQIGEETLVQIIPKSKIAFSEFVKRLINYSRHANHIMCLPKQVFYYDENRKEGYNYFWEICFFTNSFSDLDGVLDLIDDFLQQNKGGK